MQGRDPVVYEKGIVYPADQAQCLNGLVIQDSDLIQNCPVQVFKKLDTTQANRLMNGNVFLVNTLDVEGYYYCESKKPMKMLFEEGLWLIQIADYCNLDMDAWHMYPIAIQEAAVQIQIKKVEIVNFTMPEIQMQQVETIMPNLPDLSIIHPAEFEGRIAALNVNDFLVKSRAWIQWLCLGLGGLVVIMIIGFCCYRKYKCRMCCKYSKGKDKPRESVVVYDAKGQSVNIGPGSERIYPDVSDEIAQLQQERDNNE